MSKLKIPTPIATITLILTLIACITVRFIMPFSQTIEDFIPDYYKKSIDIGGFSLLLLIVVLVWEVLSNINKRT